MTAEKRWTTKDVIFWAAGLILCALGVSLCTKGSLGLSMIGAPPYILHVWLRERLAWYTQGVSEYVWEAAVLLVLCLVIRRFRWKYLLSFGTAVCSGLAIDGWLWVLGGNGPWPGLAGRIVSFAAGAVITALAIACFFRTRLPLQVYELAVTAFAERYGKEQSRVKLGFDILMLILSLALSLLLTGGLTGIGIGTVIITFTNAFMIRRFGQLLDALTGRSDQERKIS